MPATDLHASSLPFSSLGRSLLSLRRDHDHDHDSSSMDSSDLDDFQRRVADLFHDLAAAGDGDGDGDGLLSLAWVRRLLDAFLLSIDDFRALLRAHRPLLSRPPLDRLLSDFFDRAVKALDVCNAVRDGLDRLRQWRKLLEIATAHRPPPLSEAALRRAKKALTDLALLMLDDKDSAGSFLSACRNRSFGRANPSSRGAGAGARGHHRRSSGGSSGSSGSGGGGGGGAHVRSLSWSVSRQWSAAKQLQAIGSSLSAPRGHEVVATSGLAVPVFTMSSVLHFTMWALVAAIPCQDRGLQAHFCLPRSFPWAAPMLALHERIVEESKRKDRRHACGLLREIHQIERCTHHLLELTDAAQLPMAEEKEAEVSEWVQELAHVCEVLKEGLEPLERQVREAFHGIVRSRTEGLDCLSQGPE